MDIRKHPHCGKDADQGVAENALRRKDWLRKRGYRA